MNNDDANKLSSAQSRERHLGLAHGARVLALHPLKDAGHVEVVGTARPNLGVLCGGSKGMGRQCEPIVGQNTEGTLWI